MFSANFLTAPSFSILYALFDAYCFYLLSKSQSLTHNPIVFYLKATLIAGYFMFFFNGVMPFLFPSGSLGLTLADNVLYYLLSDFAAAFFAATTSFSIAPRVKPVYFFIASFTLGITALMLHVFTFPTTTVNAYGMVNRHIPDSALHLQNAMVILSFFPSSAGLIYHSLKTRFAVKGVFFTVGAFMAGIFFTLAYDTQDVSTFIFCSALSLAGWGFLILALTRFR